MCKQSEDGHCCGRHGSTCCQKCKTDSGKTPSAEAEEQEQKK